MIHSHLEGKNGNPEDVVTSNCFELLNLLGGYDLLSFFQFAKDLDGNTLFVEACRDSEAAVEFWPYLPGGGIPDGIVNVNPQGPSPFRIVVEVKHTARMGSDQLARYWRAASKLYPGRCAVVYLTQHRAFPKQDIRSSLAKAEDGQFFWLSWYHLYRWTMELSSNSSRCLVEKRILEAMRSYLAALGFSVFLGWDILVNHNIDPPYRRCYRSFAGGRVLPPYRRFYGVPVAVARENPQTYIRAYNRPLGSHFNLLVPPYNP